VDTNLQIVVSAVNDAAGPLAQVASNFNDIENAAIAAAQGSLSQWNDAADSIEGATTGLGEQFDNTMDTMNSAAAAAADSAASDWQASVSELESSLAGATTQADGDFQGMADSAATSGEEMESSISSVGGKIQMVGVQMGLLGAAIAGPAVVAVKAAGDQQDAFDQLANSVKNVAAAHGLSADATAALQQQFETASRSNTTLGVSVADSAQAFQFLYSATGNVSDTMLAYQDAINLSAAKGIDLKTATTDVVQTMNGQNRSLQVLGITTKDGLTGMDALSALNGKVGGAAKTAATEGLGPLTVAQANLNKAMADFGLTVLPVLTTFLEKLSDVITRVDDWAQAHPKLAEALLIFLALMGGLLIVVGAILVPFGLVIIGIEAFTTALTVMEVSLFAAMGTFLLYSALLIAFIAIVALIIAYHKQIEAAIVYTWNAVIDYVSDAMLNIYNAFQSWGATLSKWWSGLWDGIYSYLEGIWNKIEAIINSIESVVGGVGGAISGVAGGIGGAFSGSIKAFATGGIVNGPTLALVGEAGPEAIIPLSAFAGGTSLGGGSFGGGGGIVVNVTGNNISSQLDLRNLAQQVGQEMVRVLRLNQKLSI
jgi:hypothetical protein